MVFPALHGELNAADDTVRTWSYSGMWLPGSATSSRRAKYLAKVEALCGTKCREYAELNGVIEGTRTY